MKSQIRRRIAIIGRRSWPTAFIPGTDRFQVERSRLAPNCLLKLPIGVPYSSRTSCSAWTSSRWRALKEKTRRFFDSSAKKITSSLSFIRFCSASASNCPSVPSGFAARISYRLIIIVIRCLTKKAGTTMAAGGWEPDAGCRPGGGGGWYPGGSVTAAPVGRRRDAHPDPSPGRPRPSALCDPQDSRTPVPAPCQRPPELWSHTAHDGPGPRRTTMNSRKPWLRFAGAAGLVAGGLIAGGVLAGTLTANAAEDPATGTESSTSQAAGEEPLTGDTKTQVEDAV